MTRQYTLSDEHIKTIARALDALLRSQGLNANGAVHSVAAAIEQQQQPQEPSITES